VGAESRQTEFLAVTTFDGDRHDASLVELNEKAPSSREDRANQKNAKSDVFFLTYYTSKKLKLERGLKRQIYRGSARIPRYDS